MIVGRFPELFNPEESVSASDSRITNHVHCSRDDRVERKRKSLSPHVSTHSEGNGNLLCRWRCPSIKVKAKRGTKPLCHPRTSDREEFKEAGERPQSKSQQFVIHSMALRICKEKLSSVLSACKHGMLFLSTVVGRLSTSLAMSMLTIRDSYVAQMDPNIPEEKSVQLSSTNFLDICPRYYPQYHRTGTGVTQQGVCKWSARTFFVLRRV